MAVLAFTVGLGLILLLGFSRWKETTLRFPLIWALIATADLACLAWTAYSDSIAFSPILKSAMQFAVGALTFCPLMGVLGAKRPQEAGWNWVVLSLWIILVWPAVQAVMLPQGNRLELFLAWKFFVLGLIVLGLLNYLPTRHALSAILAAVGQYVILDAYLLDLELISPTWVPPVSAGCFLLAAILAARLRPTKDTTKLGLQEYNKQWLHFRDAYGAFWALRFLGRLMQSAELQKWTFQPTWSGFVAGEEEPSAKELQELEQAMDGFLRRFL